MNNKTKKNDRWKEGREERVFRRGGGGKGGVIVESAAFRL